MSSLILKLKQYLAEDYGKTIAESYNVYNEQINFDTTDTSTENNDKAYDIVLRGSKLEERANFIKELLSKIAELEKDELNTSKEGTIYVESNQENMC